MDWKSELKKKCLDFLKYVYNKETREILGRTPLSWGQLGLFYLIFYLAIGSFFASHLVVFVGIIPTPGPGVTPWNFGQYAYSNYPNAKLGLIAIPSTVLANGTHTSYSSDYKESMESFLDDANKSKINCLNATANFGFHSNKACVLLHVAKVFQWTPNSLNQFVTNPVTGDYLNMSCEIKSNVNIQLSFEPTYGIPLNISNSQSGQSFPYNNQHNYSVPLVAVVLDFANVNISSDFNVDVTCGVDLVSLGIANYTQSRLDRIYELPSNVTFTVSFRRSDI